MPDGQIAEPRPAEALADWHRRRGDRKMPRRADIDPTEITTVLPHLRLIDVLEGGARYRYRLVGAPSPPPADRHGQRHRPGARLGAPALSVALPRAGGGGVWHPGVSIDASDMDPDYATRTSRRNSSIWVFSKSPLRDSSPAAASTCAAAAPASPAAWLTPPMFSDTS